MNFKFLDKGIEIANTIANKPTKTAEPGSVIHMLAGAKPSTQSTVIMLGNEMEYWFQFVAEESGADLMPSGKNVLKINGKWKDVDFLVRWNGKLFYRELKANLGLDSEKMPVTFKKILEVKEALENEYNEEVDAGLLTWTRWSIEDIPSRLINNEYGVSIDAVSEFNNLFKAGIINELYFDMFKEMNKIIKL